MKNSIKFLSLSIMLFFIAGCAQQVLTQQPAVQQPAPQTTNPAPVITQEQAATAQAQNPQNISILNYAFDPATTTVKVGTTVTWTNNDPVTHKIVSDPNPADANAPAFSSDDLAQGGSYSFTFTTAGTFNYHCQIHPSMKGTVTVTP